MTRGVWKKQKKGSDDFENFVGGDDYEMDLEAMMAGQS
jgi:hypothetical protein